jgi:hypothetical protein
MIAAMKGGCGGSWEFFCQHVVPWALRWTGAGRTGEDQAAWAELKWDSIRDAKIGAAFVYGEARRAGFSEVEDFDDLDDEGASERERTPKTGRKLPAEDFCDISEIAETEDIVEGLLVRGEMSVFFGPPKSGKSFLCMDLGFYIALGWTWFERRTERGGALYIVGEGAIGGRKRIAAFKKAHDLPADDKVPFTLIPTPVDLFTGTDVQPVIDAIRDAEQRHGVPIVLVVFDTLARMLVGGDESQTQDMNKFIANVDRIVRATGVHALTVHHPGKDASRGMRGSSALSGAIDTSVQIGREEGSSISTVRVAFQRNLESGDTWSFGLEQVKLGTDRRGNAITSCVVRPIVAPELPALPTGLKPGTSFHRAYRVLCDCIAQHGAPLPEGEGFPSSALGVERDLWRNLMCPTSATSTATPSERSMFSKQERKLLKIGAISEKGGFVWLTVKPCATE